MPCMRTRNVSTTTFILQTIATFNVLRLSSSEKCYSLADRAPTLYGGVVKGVVRSGGVKGSDEEEEETAAAVEETPAKAKKAKKAKSSKKKKSKKE